ncbi:MAG TPA: NAD(P)/FAD-dependent oxidoreductase [Beutenbergiaceae bacterium]|nr:NAD(P)/FAD-dependent oxidoreductase [Beutenbergiaceae bacterium]
MNENYEHSGGAPHEFDVVVIGAGPVGENVADYAHQGGLSAAIVESDLVGGECSYWACIPSKALLRPVRAVDAARRVAGAREVTGDRVAAAAAFERRDSFVSGYDDSGQVDWVKSAGVTLVRGRGRLAGPRRVAVETCEGELILSAREGVVVCTGSEAVLPPIDGLAQAHPWTSREATSMREVPGRIAIIGGGVVACEMATAAAGLGAEQVTMLVREDRLLTNAEPFASALVRDGLGAAGVEVRFGTNATKVRRRGGESGAGSGTVTLTLDGAEELVVDEVLVATGRRPRTGDLGLETVGLDPGDPLTTDDTLAVTFEEEEGAGGARPWLFAAGDVNGRAPLTHHGKYQARLLGSRLAAQARSRDGHAEGEAPGASERWGEFTPTADTDALVQVIFTDPQVAMVGLTRAQTLERGVPARTVEFDLGAVSGAALHADGYTGRAALTVDVDREVLVGATLVGQDVGEMIHAATIAVVGEIPLARLWHAVPAFPTMSEVWLRLLEEWRRN